MSIYPECNAAWRHLFRIADCIARCEEKLSFYLTYCLLHEILFKSRIRALTLSCKRFRKIFTPLKRTSKEEKLKSCFSSFTFTRGGSLLLIIMMMIVNRSIVYEQQSKSVSAMFFLHIKNRASCVTPLFRAPQKRITRTQKQHTRLERQGDELNLSYKKYLS